MRSIKYHKTSQIGNVRPTNEDREICFLNLDDKGQIVNPKYAAIDLFIICDGHGGSKLSDFVSNRLHFHLTDKNLHYPLHDNIFVIISKKINQEIIANHNKIAYDCGTTALVIVRCFDVNFKQILQIMNVGDCRAVINNNGLAIPLTIDHKPFNSQEKLRIAKVNFELEDHRAIKNIYYDGSDWRIHNLSVSRAFGDFDSLPQVTFIPQIFNYYVNNEEFLIMGCDGLWDVLSNSEAINFVYDHYHGNQIDCYEIITEKNVCVYPTTKSSRSNNIAHKLAQYAIAKGSNDNVSIIILFFR